eukprot:CAMPEP_0206036336 /NCGR_PEP_ID=MMETSP1466-20131121/2690_1 /ASSEMBLY_ACC=CAM_ASM_001126 /TAXON_ID=44452 /ORGANISM="Pavlova gyrans, Strain CCMP608" /LENGTH=153 /DNA_ID=CAMNT_0053410793 /DNA_START=280 /DNA_END=740 /DNA_ORIENTATION=-
MEFHSLAALPAASGGGGGGAGPGPRCVGGRDASCAALMPPDAGPAPADLAADGLLVNNTEGVHDTRHDEANGRRAYEGEGRVLCEEGEHTRTRVKEALPPLRGEHVKLPLKHPIKFLKYGGIFEPGAVFDHRYSEPKQHGIHADHNLEGVREE